MDSDGWVWGNQVDKRTDAAHSRPHSSLNSNKEQAAGWKARVGAETSGGQILTSDPALSFLPSFCFVQVSSLHNTVRLRVCLRAVAWHRDCNRSDRWKKKKNPRGRDEVQNCLLMIWPLTPAQRLPSRLTAELRTGPWSREPQAPVPREGWFYSNRRRWCHSSLIFSSWFCVYF